jgi:hypothetical protein
MSMIRIQTVADTDHDYPRPARETSPFDYMRSTVNQPIDRPRDGDRMGIWERCREERRASAAIDLARWERRRRENGVRTAVRRRQAVA